MKVSMQVHALAKIILGVFVSMVLFKMESKLFPMKKIA